MLNDILWQKETIIKRKRFFPPVQTRHPINGAEPDRNNNLAQMKCWPKHILSLFFLIKVHFVKPSFQKQSAAMSNTQVLFTDDPKEF